ncbi:BglG family transcription antiterminator [Sporolactobacillus shoreae]|nr:BglG family transcription antiterminator [Sporolactobacillus shoreae]
MKAISNPCGVKEAQIIKFILAQKKTRYADISNYMKLSKRTVAKYLDAIDDIIKPFDLKLVRKQNNGIYFEGDVRPLFQPLVTSGNGIPGTKDERVLYIFSQLLMNFDFVTIQQLAENMFVSRSTVEGDLKEVKAFLEKSHVSLSYGQKGIRIETTERLRRDLVSKLIRMYWGRGSYAKKENGKLTRDIKLPSDLEHLFDSDTLNKVLSSLDEFFYRSRLDFTDYEFQSLAIHLIIAVERIKKNKFLATNNTKFELEQNTLMLIEILQEKFQIKIPEEEKNYINIHIIAVQRKAMKQDDLIWEDDLIRKNSVAKFLKSNLNLTSYDDELIKGLTLHLLSALKRLHLGLTIFNPYTSQAKRFFPEAYEYALDLKCRILQKYGVDLNEDETAFIALHIESYLERNKANPELKIVVVCSSGIGTSRLLEQRIHKYFQNDINITRVLSLQELNETEITEDIIISTINIDAVSVPVVVVSPFLNNQDIEQIRRIKNSLTGSMINSSHFVTLLDPRLIFINPDLKYRDEVIQFISAKLVSFKLAKPEIFQSALEREKLSSTAFNNISIPHAQIDYVLDPRIVVLISKKGIVWGEETVNIVFFIALNKKVHKEIESIYQYFNEILEDSSKLNKIKNANSREEVLAVLKGGDPVCKS